MGTHHTTGLKARILETLAQEGALTKDELGILLEDILIKSSNPKALDNSLTAIRATGEIQRVNDKWQLANKQVIKPHTNGANMAVQASTVLLSDYQRKRTGATIELYHSPDSFEDVAQLSVCVAGAWFKLPMPPNGLRICVGNGIPQWSVNQETNKGISVIRIAYKNGRMHDEKISPDMLVTIADIE